MSGLGQIGSMALGGNSPDDGAVDETRMEQILESAPKVDLLDPIGALKSFCKSRLKFEVEFIVRRHSSWTIDQQRYEIQVFFPGRVLIAQCEHTTIQYAKELAAKDALKTINYDIALLKHYVQARIISFANKINATKGLFQIPIGRAHV